MDSNQKVCSIVVEDYEAQDEVQSIEENMPSRPIKPNGKCKFQAKKVGEPSIKDIQNMQSSTASRMKNLSQYSNQEKSKGCLKSSKVMHFQEKINKNSQLKQQSQKGIKFSNTINDVFTYSVQQKQKANFEAVSKKKSSEKGNKHENKQNKNNENVRSGKMIDKNSNSSKKGPDQECQLI